MMGYVRDVKTGRYSQWSAPWGRQPEQAVCLAALSKCEPHSHPAAANRAWATGIALLVVWNKMTHCGFKTQSKGDCCLLCGSARPSIGTFYLTPESLHIRKPRSGGSNLSVPSEAGTESWVPLLRDSAVFPLSPFGPSLHPIMWTMLLNPHSLAVFLWGVFLCRASLTSSTLIIALLAQWLKFCEVFLHGDLFWSWQSHKGQFGQKLWFIIYGWENQI